MNHPSSIDTEALTLASVIEQIYQQPSPGGDGQRKAKVQCLLIDILGNGYRREQRLKEAKAVAELSGANWQKRYREITGEAG